MKSPIVLYDGLLARRPGRIRFSTGWKPIVQICRSSLLCVLLCGAALAEVKLPTPPDGFDITLFAAPPEVNYPTCIAAAPTGELLVGVDKQGSLGKKPGEGKVVMCADTNGDGKADKFTTFATMDHPRGLVYDNGTLWVLHPPTLSVYFDDNGDGVADRSQVLVTGISTDQVKHRGADHTTNGIRLGIDGWIYIAVGDFGFVDAKGVDGKTLSLRGGGVARVRPDGSELEMYAYGLRNIVDMAVDPRLNVFTRDNTNDGGGWDIRLSHIVQSGHYGYPSLFRNFDDEILRPLADYGGGSGCGAMFVSEPWLPEKYRDALLTCDWGRDEVFYQPLTSDGATFRAAQETFLKIPRPTDIDADGLGNLFVSNWQNGQFAYSGENVGYVVRLRPKDSKAPSFPQLSKLDDAALVAELNSASHVRRLHTQRETLRRGERASVVEPLVALLDKGESLDARIAAIFTYKQLLAAKSHAELVKLASAASVREYALRALADRKTQGAGVPIEPFVAGLGDKNPRVQVAAMVALARLGKVEAADKIVPLLASAETDAKAIAPTPNSAQFRSKIITGRDAADIELKIEGAKKLFLVVGDGGNGIGSDHAAWLDPRLIAPDKALKLTELKWSSATAAWGSVNLGANCEKSPLRVAGNTIADGIGTHAHSVIAYDLPAGYTTFKARGTLDDSGGSQGSVVFMVFVDHLPESAAPQGNTKDVADPARVLPHVAYRALAELNAADACLAALDGPSRDNPSRDGALRAMRWMHSPAVVDGLVARLAKTGDVAVRQAMLATLIRLYHKEGVYKGSWWGTRPDTTGPYYERVKWEETPQIEAVIRGQLATADAKTVEWILAELNKHRIALADLPAGLVQDAARRESKSVAIVIPAFDPKNPKQLGNLPFEKILADATAAKGDARLGAELFKRQNCAACHAIAPGQAPIGPQLVDIGQRYKREQLVESIVKPSAVIAQGFATNVFATDSGKVHTGFVVREAANEIEIRAADGTSLVLKQAEIDERSESKVSVMPDGLVNNLTAEELASLIAYLESLRSE